MRRDGEPVLDGLVDLTNTNFVEVFLNTNAGVISGRIVDESGHPTESGVHGLLLADPFKFPLSFYRQFTTDRAGAFSLRAIPPGNYRVYSWKDIPPTMYFDPDLLQRSRTRAAVVRVNERSEVSIDVKVMTL